MQRAMNEAAAQGWILRDFRVGHALWRANPEQPDGEPLFLAVFHRDDYDREAHRDALVRRNDAELALLKKRREIERALGEVGRAPTAASNGRPS